MINSVDFSLLFLYDKNLTNCAQKMGTFLRPYRSARLGVIFFLVRKNFFSS